MDDSTISNSKYPKIQRSLSMSKIQNLIFEYLLDFYWIIVLDWIFLVQSNNPIKIQQISKNQILDLWHWKRIEQPTFLDFWIFGVGYGWIIHPIQNPEKSWLPNTAYNYGEKNYFNKKLLLDLLFASYWSRWARRAQAWRSCGECFILILSKLISNLLIN
jgi:hypothetical protein